LSWVKYTNSLLKYIGLQVNPGSGTWVVIRAELLEEEKIGRGALVTTSSIVASDMVSI